MSAFTRLLAGAGRVRVLAAARVRTATAGSTAALRAAATRASALLRAPVSSRPRFRDGSPRWRATVRPAVEDFLQGLPGPAELFRRTRDSLAELRWSLPSTESLGPALRDLVQAVPRPGAGSLLGGRGRGAEEALRRRPVGLLERLRLRPRARDAEEALRLRRGTERRPRAGDAEEALRLRRGTERRHFELEPHGDDVLVVDDDDDRTAAKLEAALRRLCKSFWDAFLDPHRLKTWFGQLRHKAPGQPQRRLGLRPVRPRTTPRPISSSRPALRIQMIPTGDRLQWILLGSVALVDAHIAPGVQIQLDADTPPQPSRLAVSPQIISGPLTSLEDHPYVAAVLNPGHLLLLRARPDLYLCDIASGTATRLPLPVPGALLAPDTIAIVSRVDGDGFLLLALQHAPAAGMRTVLSFDSRTWTWSDFAVAVEGEGVPVGGGDRPWSFSHGVVSHGRRIAWVDLRFGFLLLDAHGQDRTLRFVSLPTGRALPAHTTGVDRLRCAALSQGVVRYAELIELDAPHVELWRFDEEDRTWLRGGTVRMDAGLHTDLPWVVAIHPHEDVVFVMVGSTIHAVDVRRGRVIAEDFFQLPLPPEPRSSYFVVRAWEFA